MRSLPLPSDRGRGSRSCKVLTHKEHRNWYTGEGTRAGTAAMVSAQVGTRHTQTDLPRDASPVVAQRTRPDVPPGSVSVSGTEGVRRGRGWGCRGTAALAGEGPSHGALPGQNSLPASLRRSAFSSPLTGDEVWNAFDIRSRWSEGTRVTMTEDLPESRVTPLTTRPKERCLRASTFGRGCGSIRF